MLAGPGHSRAGFRSGDQPLFSAVSSTTNEVCRGESSVPAVGVPALPLAHLGAGAVRDLERRLVAGRLDDHVIAGLQQGVVEEEDALLGARGDDHLAGAGPLVERGYRLAEPGVTQRLGVPAPGFQQPLVRAGLEFQQVTHRARLAVAARQHVPRAVLIPCVEALDPERAQFHGAQYRAAGPAAGLRPGRDWRWLSAGYRLVSSGSAEPDSSAAVAATGPPAAVWPEVPRRAK